MGKCILIDTTNMRLLKVHESADCLSYWADILVPYGDYTIRGMRGRDFSVFTQLELRLLYQSLTGTEPPESTPYPSLIKGLRIEIDKLEIDETSLEKLQEKLGRPLAPPDFTVRPEEKEKTDTPRKPQTLKRPGADTTTGKVWEIADCLNDGENDFPDRKGVIDACVEHGIHPSTASTQFGKWKKFMSLDLKKT